MSRPFVLSYALVDEIRDLYSTGEYSQQQLAELYDVGQMTISRAVRLDQMRHISWLEHNERKLQADSMSVSEAVAIPDNPGFWVTDKAKFFTCWDMRAVVPWHEKEIIPIQTHWPSYGIRNFYPRVTLYRKQITVPVAVLIAFRGPCPAGMESIHLDDDPLNNCLANLKWGTHVDNCVMRGHV